MQIEEQQSEIRFFPEGGIDVRKIEAELMSMWTEMSRPESGTDAPALTRACTLNLIVYTTELSDSAHLADILDEVARRHPARTLLLVTDRDSTETRLAAYVATRCQILGARTKQVCGEQITIEVAGNAVDLAASAIAPLLVPDVPVFLWWDDIPHQDDQLFSRILAMTDRAVIDSAAFDNPYDDLLKLDTLMRNGDSLISDLNWGRLTSWRSLTASFWDVADYRPHLDNIDKVIVEFQPPGVASDQVALQPLLLVGWIASRLSWKLESANFDKGNNITHISYLAPNHPVNVIICGSEYETQEIDPLKSIRLLYTTGRAEFSVILEDEGSKLETTAITPDRPAVQRLVACEAKSDGQRLSSELSFLKRDKVYEGAVSAAAEIIKAVRS